VREMSFMSSIRSVNRLHQVAHNMFADSPLGTLDCIERVVLEDVYSIATGLAHPSSSPASLVTIYDDCKARIANERHGMDVVNSIVAAMG
jgi:hypothetical protein